MSSFLDDLKRCLEKASKTPTISQQLAQVPGKLSSLAANGQIGECEEIAQYLGTAVGQQREWQVPFRENGILSHAIRKADPSLTPNILCKQYLRVIGNCVADNDLNRETILGEFANLISCLKEAELSTHALVVMFNLCNDYEPAQIKAAQLRLDSVVAEYLAADRIPEEAVDYATDLLVWATEKLATEQLKDDISVGTFSNLLQVSLHFDEDHYPDYIAICSDYLRDPEFHQKVIVPEIIERLVDLSFGLDDRLDHKDIFHALDVSKGPEKVDSENSNIVTMVQLINGLSAISSTDAFINTFGLHSPVIKKIISRISQPTSMITPSAVSSWIVLGNLSTSDQASIEMVSLHLHETILQVFATARHSSLLYAAAGTMRHLAFPEQNRQILGETRLIESCCELLMQQDPSLRGEIAALIGKLLLNNDHNIRKVVFEHLPKRLAPTQQTDEIDQPPKVLDHIISQALAPSAPLPSTAMKNPMIELGRSIIVMLRYALQSNVPDLLLHIFQRPLVARPIVRLVRQSFYPDARSDGLFGLGLMAQWQEGAKLLIEEIKADEGLLKSIKEFVTERKKEGTEVGVPLGRDHQNMIVLLHGLIKNGADVMDSSMQSDVEALQTELSKLLV